MKIIIDQFPDLKEKQIYQLSSLKKIYEKWKVAWMQRSSGQSDMTLWNN